MATGGGGSIYHSSEPFYDFSCSVCANDDKHTEGQLYCVECDEVFCTSCLVFHNKIAKMRKHELLDKTKMVTRKPQQDLVQLPTTMCIAHPGQVINMHCGQDNLVCCTVCIAENHRTCVGVIYIPTKAKNIKTSEEFKNVNDAIETMRTNMEVLEKGKKLDLKRITEHNLQILVSIKETRNKINKHFDDLEISARKNLERKFKIHEDKINQDLAKLKDQLSELEETAAKLREGNNEAQVFVEMKEANKKQQERTELLKTIEKSVGKSAMHFVPNNEIFNILEQKSLGILEDEKTFSSVVHHSDFNIKTVDDNENCWITGSCQMLDGSVVITDTGNRKVKLLDTSYNVVTDCQLPNRPLDVCRISPAEVAITLPNVKMIQFAEVTDKITLKGSFSVGDKCRGIAYNEGLMYVACGGQRDKGQGPGQVQVYDRLGNLLQTFMKDKHNTDLFTIPSHIALSENIFYISDRDGIVTMNLDGTKNSKFTSPDLKNPVGICVINNGDIVVVGISSNNMIMFDKEGQQKTVLLKQTDGIIKPNSVSYDRQNSRLTVTQQDSDQIKVYNLL